MHITTEQIKELRDKTGVSVMQCKKALEEAEGDAEKALLILKKKSTDIAAKKADRATSDGLIVMKSAPGKTAVVVLNCETDFVAKNEDFIALANDMAVKALEMGKEKVMELAPELINPVVQKVGENIVLGQVEIFEGSSVGSYIHNGKSGAVVVLEGGSETLGKDIAMHAAAMKPEFLATADVSEDMKAKLKDLFQKEVDESGKPDEIKAKMMDGKIATYLKERVLLEQPFIKNPDITIAALAAKDGATVKKFVLFSL